MSESGATEREPDPTSERLAQRGGATEPDVLLDIPELTVDQLRLAVDGLDADLSLRARLANLVQIDAGVRVHLEGVELDVSGVSAEALLKVRLEKLVQILDRALTTIDRNPHVIDALARTAAVSIDDVDRVAPTLGGEAVPVGDRIGQQVGTVGAVADQTLRERIAEPSPPAPTPPVGARPPEPPTGPGPTGLVPAETGAAGGERPGSGGGAAEEPDTGRTDGPEVDAVPAGAEQSATGPEAGKAAGGRGAGRPGASGAAQMAGQAGETLRQAGRSVWEAIQGGMGQHRPKR
ncbi:hypothetical protein MRQ36_13960 [Micromonospora sp. R77]|uniref:hypothetical protein n=1 Tax=Micromonospora sp. R77 TaxID=2925836 RepID=UPI001F6186A2|nr:hypothetical protein [Micromonospora sp. R77]MCI4063631.1 hypothetical protein [Micromonospora sp. R77]